MYCSTCGANIEESAKFCKNCGSHIQNPAPIKKRASKGNTAYSIIVSILCIILSGCLVWLLNIHMVITKEVAATNTIQLSSKEEPETEEISDYDSADSVSGFLNIKQMNFDTPEAAIQHFSKKLAANDIRGALQACAIDEGGYYDFPNAVQDTGVYTVSSKWPGRYNMYQDINRMSRLGDYANRIKGLTWSLLIPEADWNTPLGKNSEDGGELMQDTNLFEKRLDPSMLSSLKVEQIASYPIPSDIIENVRKNDKRRASHYGAKSLVEKGVLYRYDGQFFMGGYKLIETESGWNIHEFGASFFGVSIDLKPITKEEWNQMIQ